MKKLVTAIVASGLVLGLGGCEEEPASSPAAPDAGSDVEVDGGSTVENECTPATAGPTTHRDNVNAPETWTAAGSPHIVQGDITINGALTIEPCAEVLIAPQRAISVSGTGSILANGTATRRIHFGASEAGKPYLKIRSGGGRIELAYATVDGGGDPSNILPYLTGMIDIQGSNNMAPTQELLKVDHVTVSGSATNGIVLRDGGGFVRGSNDLVVTASALHPINAWARAMGTLPRGTYTGNAKDEILIPAIAGNEAVRESATMKNLGVPYLIGHPTSQGTLYVAATPGNLATLTIEAGTILKFKQGGLFDIEPSTGVSPATGALVARGTASNPIVFTSASATPAPGDWRGIWFGQVPAAANAIDHARVEWAGGDSVSGSDSCMYPAGGNNDAAIRIFGAPSSVFVTNTVIANSAKHGIDVGYRSDAKHDFRPTNTFTNVPRCVVTYQRDVSGACPSSVPCPTM